MIQAVKQYKYISFISVYFVAILLISNIASTKIIDLGKIVLDGGTILFPLTYIFDDVLTEVYGYSKSREVIWLGFIAAITMSFLLFLVGALPANKDWGHQDAYMLILGQTPRIVLGSLIAYLAGEFVNSFILAKMKLLTHGKWLWTRTIGSTLAGELLDSVIFVSIAFYGLLPDKVLADLIIFNYLFKSSLEIILTPLTYMVVGFLKKKEAIDYFDTNTNFNPLNVFKHL